MQHAQLIPRQQRTNRRRFGLVTLAAFILISTPHISPATAAAPVSTIDSTDLRNVQYMDVEVGSTVVFIDVGGIEGSDRVSRWSQSDSALETVFKSSNCESSDGNGFPPFSGEHCWMTAVAAGVGGDVFVRSWTDARIWHVTADGTAAVLAGDGTDGTGGDGGLAVDAQIRGNDDFPAVGSYGMDVGPDGSVYFTDGAKVRKVGPDGIVSTVAGTGVKGYSGDGGPATDAEIDNAHDLAVGPDGSLYIATNDYRVRKVAPDGTISTYAGIGESGHSGDGGLAAQAQLTTVYSIGVDRVGGLYLSDSGRLRYVDRSGMIDTIAGDGTHGYTGDGGPAVDAVISTRHASVLTVDQTSGDVYLNNPTIDQIVVRRITRQGSLAGTLSDVSGSGVEGVVVSVADAGSGVVVASTVSAGDGSWWVELSPGFYNVHFDASAPGLVSEFFDDAAGEGDAAEVVVEPARETIVDAVLWYVSVCGGEGVGPFVDVGAGHLLCSEIEWLAESGVANGFLDGTFRPSGVLSRGGAAAWLRGAFDDGSGFVAPAVPTFGDVGVDHLFFEDIEWLAASGVANGFLDGTFRPSAALSRGGAAAWLHASVDDGGFVAPATASFSDVPVGHLFFEQIEWMAASGTANGFLDGTFGVNRAVTRQGAGAFIARAATDAML